MMMIKHNSKAERSLSLRNRRETRCVRADFQPLVTQGAVGRAERKSTGGYRRNPKGTRGNVERGKAKSKLKRKFLFRFCRCFSVDVSATAVLAACKQQ